MPKPHNLQPMTIARNPMVSNAIAYRNYVKAGGWKCSASPTGAHFRRVDDAGNQRCVYCGDVIERDKSKGIW